jgi:hypothetical protein
MERSADLRVRLCERGDRFSCARRSRMTAGCVHAGGRMRSRVMAIDLDAKERP